MMSDMLDVDWCCAGPLQSENTSANPDIGGDSFEHVSGQVVKPMGLIVGSPDE